MTLYTETSIHVFKLQGGFGACCKVRETATDRLYACKVIKFESLVNEIDIHSTLSHQSVVKFIAAERVDEIVCISEYRALEK